MTLIAYIAHVSSIVGFGSKSCGCRHRIARIVVQLLDESAAEIPVRFARQPHPIEEERAAAPARGHLVEKQERSLPRAQSSVALLAPSAPGAGLLSENTRQIWISRGPDPTESILHLF